MIIDLGAGAPVRPVITFKIGDTEYRYTGTDIDITGKLKLTADGTSGWKMWVYDSLNFTFNFIASKIDICAVGHGAVGNRGTTTSDSDGVGGPGGKGGQVINELNYTDVRSGDQFVINIFDNAGNPDQQSTESQTIVTQKRDNAVLKTWSPTTGGGANGGVGLWWVNGGIERDSTSGADGTYAFNDSTFDNIKYAPGGGGGTFTQAHDPGTPEWMPTGATVDALGCGGGGAMGTNWRIPPGQGKKGVVLMRFKP